MAKFKVQFGCTVTAIKASAVESVVYYLSEPGIPVTPTFSLDNKDCPHELSYTVTQADGSALPAPIQNTVDSKSSPVLKIASNDFGQDQTTYTIKATVTDKIGGVSAFSEFKV